MADPSLGLENHAWPEGDRDYENQEHGYEIFYLFMLENNHEDKLCTMKYWDVVGGSQPQHSRGRIPLNSHDLKEDWDYGNQELVCEIFLNHTW